MKTPAELGYRMPAEWELHAATWLSWPRREGRSFTGAFDPVLPVFRAVVEAVLESEPVCINVFNLGHEKKARSVLQGLPMARISFHRVPTDEPWCRDYGPMFVTRKRGQNRLAIVDWDYCQDGKSPRYDFDDAVPMHVAKILEVPIFSGSMNLEGGAIDVNGAGALLATESCLLNRKPKVSRSQIEKHLRSLLGVREILWLSHGIAGDQAHGHIDNVARFVSPTKILAAVEEDRDDPNYQPLQRNLARLRSHKIDIVTLPMPRKIVRQGLCLPASYANFYIANSCVLVPTFADPNDEAALAILKDSFPGRAIVEIDCRDLLWGLGGLHCLTQQQPAI